MSDKEWEQELMQEWLDGTSGQDRESYSDTQDRESYAVDEDWDCICPIEYPDPDCPLHGEEREVEYA